MPPPAGRACSPTSASWTPTGNLLPPGEQGEIVVRGDLVMTGYYNMPDKTAETIIDGWLHTGDLGVFDERGYLFLRDRLREVIITGGFNVYPSDVETVLSQHPAVAECAVIRYSRRSLGRSRACRGRSQDRHDDRSGAEVIAFVKDELGSVKTPKVIHVFDSDAQERGRQSAQERN